MALRVLLADESSTIKKAIQMALSELGVDVKSVPSGLDVLPVSRTYKPDLIFADILLTKKNGYEVCAEIKNDPELKRTPVILMWSSFMQLDQANFIRVKAEASLEKPFDSEALRSIVERYAPKASQFPLRGLLNHPALPDFEDSDTFVKQRTEYLSTQQQIEKNHVPIPIEEIESIDDVDDFAEVPLGRPKQNQADDWSTSSPATGDQFVVETESYGDFEEVTVMTTSPQAHTTPNLQQKIQDQLNTYIQDSPLAKSKAPPGFQRPISSLDEQIMKEEIRMMAEKICWQILPEITEKIVREELSKLLNGLEKT